MTDQTLAQASDIAIWASMVVLTLAMLARGYKLRS